MTEIDTSTEAEARGVEKERERCAKKVEGWRGEVRCAKCGRPANDHPYRHIFQGNASLEALSAAIREGETP